MRRPIRNSLDRAIVRPREDSPYIVLKGKKIFKYHVNNRRRTWMGNIAHAWRRIVDVHH